MAILHTFAVTGPGSARPATVGGGACCAARKDATFLASPGESGNIPGVRHGPDWKIQVPQNPLGQDPASDRGRGEAVLVPLQTGSPEAALARCHPDGPCCA